MHKIFANTLFIGKQFISLPSCHSTNDIALQMAAESLLHDGAVIHAETQTNGRGQRGNQWLATGKMNLTFSLYLEPKFLVAHKQFELNRLISVAIAEVLEELLSSNSVYVKWPNDVFVGQQKIAGILIENTLNNNGIGRSIIGIGLNVNQQEALPPQATSMIQNAGRPFELMHVLDLLIMKIEKYFFMLKRGDIDNLHKNYVDHLYQKGITAIYRDKGGVFEGVIKDVRQDGVLEIIDQDQMIRSYQFKEVSFL